MRDLLGSLLILGAAVTVFCALSVLNIKNACTDNPDQGAQSLHVPQPELMVVI